MTEQEWDATADPRAMVLYLRGKTSTRKLRLFAAACCRRVWPHLVDARSRNAVEVVERYAEGADSRQDLSAAHGAASRAAGQWLWQHSSSLTDDENTLAAAAVAAQSASRPTCRAVVVADSARQAAQYARSVERLAGTPLPDTEQFQCGLLQCVIGNPFRPVGLDPAWRTPIVTALATGIYAEQAHDRLPILADALQEAGCEDRDVLDHCRGDGPHARGCWVVDLVLGKD